MICENCLHERKKSDFLLDHLHCYKCVYQKKISCLDIKKNKKCKICETEIYDRNKISYCSKECAKMGSKINKHDSWLKSYYGAPGYFKPI